MQNQNKIFKRYTEARESLRLQQSDIAKELGVSPSSISNFEAGRKKKPHTAYADFLESKGICPLWLLNGNGNMLTKENKIEEVKNDRYKELEEENKELKAENKRIRQNNDRFQDKFFRMEAEISGFKELLILFRKELSQFRDISITDTSVVDAMLGFNLNLGKFRGVPQVSGGLTKVVSLKIAS